MRIAIYDGILETHLADSLARALRRRGHEVFNTGRFGKGFTFPARSDDIGPHMHALGTVLDFHPDVVFVMRPASLPFQLLELLKKSRAILMAWFSDDPVLFDLSYGPVLTSYDYVLHCGNRRILQFYENKFGFPTGVNFPFWTDHEAFPRIWGNNPITTDFIFLGNVHDEVRRERYFDLGRMTSRVRIHGQVGADYYGLFGGYLDDDYEIACSAASTRMALNIPQFFRNHNSLQTWFEGLGELGFFEYPSRVVQYMAMGIPTVSIIPGGHSFLSYPEMFVVEDPHEADSFAQLLTDAELQQISAAISKRFDTNFSADARVLAIESLLGGDGWQKLNAADRELWFSQFSPSTPSEKTHHDHISPSNQASIALSSCRPRHPVYLFGTGWTKETSRIMAIKEALQDIGTTVHTLNPSSFVGALAKDNATPCQYRLETTVLQAQMNQIHDSVLIICGLDVILDNDSSIKLHSMGVRTVLIDDTGKLDLDRGALLACRYSVLATSSVELAERLQSRGFDNVFYLPHFVRPSYTDILKSASHRRHILHIHDTSASERLIAPALADLDPAVIDTRSYHDLEAMSLEELASETKTSVLLITPGGTKRQPILSPLMAYLTHGAEFVFSARYPVPELIDPLSSEAVLVQHPGELAVKLNHLLSSAHLQNYYQQKLYSTRELFDGKRLAMRLLQFTESRLSPSPSTRLSNGCVLDLALPDSERDGQAPYLLVFHISPLEGEFRYWYLRVYSSETTFVEFQTQACLCILLPKGERSDIRVQLCYRGPSRSLSVEHAIRATAQVKNASFRPTNIYGLEQPLLVPCTAAEEVFVSP